MKRTLLLVAVLSALAAVVPAASLARQQTTSPAYNFVITVTITDKNVVLSAADAKRGWLAHFTIVNKSKHPAQFEVGGLKSMVIPPGGKGKVGAYLDTRGQYPYKVNNERRGYFQVV